MSPQRVGVDGGLGRSDALLQAQADMMQVSVERAAQAEFITARGAAWMAGVTGGVWPDREAAAATKADGVLFTPAIDRAEFEVRRAAWGDAVQRALGWRRADLPGA